jgi:hypothetical protein
MDNEWITDTYSNGPINDGAANNNSDKTIVLVLLLINSCKILKTES